MAANISMVPAFTWWVPHTLKKNNHIILKVKSNNWLKNHKFWINIPKNMQQAIEFDRENGYTLWWDMVCQKMKNLRPEFDPREKPKGNIPPGY